MKVALLVSDDPHQNHLINLLAPHFDICGVIVEPGQHQQARLWKRRRYVDWGYRRYHQLRRRISGHARYRRQFFDDGPTSDWRDVIDSSKVTEVDWINSPQAIAKMEQWRPDVAVVCGTNYVRSTVLAPAARAFNIHAGCLPDYKGNHGVFFAFAEGRYDLIGATIHEVSATLDGGAIVEIIRPPVYPEDNDESLYCRADRLAMVRLVDLLRRIERGEDVPAHPQPDAGRTFRHRDRSPWLEASVWMQRRLRRSSAPCLPTTRISTTVEAFLDPSRHDEPLVEYSRLGVN